MKYQKGFISLAVLLIIVVGVTVVGGGAYYVVSQPTPAPSPTYSSSQTPTPTPTPSSAPISTPPSSNVYQVTFQDLDLDLECLGYFGLGPSREFVVRTKAEYQRLIDTSRSDRNLYPNLDLSCPDIDFSKNTLLGKSDNGAGCSSEVKKMVLRNDDSREVTYSITPIFKGTCEMVISHNNFVLVPSIPGDYAVKFEVNSKNDL